MSAGASGRLVRATLIAGAFLFAQAASAGRVILNNDEWTFSDYSFQNAPDSTTAFAHNLAAYMNIDGGPCNLLVYSVNFGLTSWSFRDALNSAGCTVTYSTGTFDLPTLSAYDGVFLGRQYFNYDAAVLTSYVNSGHSVYIAGGTGIANEDTVWDSFTHSYGLDFGQSYNSLKGWYPIVSNDPLLAGVSEIYVDRGNSVGLFGSDPEAQIIAYSGDGQGLIGIYEGEDEESRITAVPEPRSVALIGIGLAGLAAARRRKKN